MGWKQAALLIILSISLIAAYSYNITPSETLRLKIYDSKPFYKIPPPDVQDGRVYSIGGRGDKLVAITLSGEKLWSVNLGSKVSTPPLVIPDAYYGYAKRESWIVVVTDAFELKAYTTASGERRIDGLRLPSSPSGSPMLYLNDGKTVIVPLSSSLQAVDLRSKSLEWSVDLGFRPSYVFYLDGRALVAGGKKIAYLDLRGRNALWSVEFGDDIVAVGVDDSLAGVVLKNGTMVSIEAKSGRILTSRDIFSILGEDIPRGRFPVGKGVAALTGSKEIVAFIDLRNLEVLRTLKVWLPPASQPIAIGKALLYFSKEGKIKIYHYTLGFLLSELEADPPLSEVSVKEGANYTSILTYLDDEGELHMLELPSYWIKLQEASMEDNGYLIEGFICSTIESGGRSLVKVYVMSPQGEIEGEKIAGFLDDGGCGARFSTFMKGKGAVGLIVNDIRLNPSVPVGFTRQEWISLKAVTSTPTPTETQTTTKPSVKPKLSFNAPKILLVGDPLKVEVRGVNGWGAEELTFILKGPTIEEVSIRRGVDPGSEFEVTLESRAINPGIGAALYVMHGDSILYEGKIPLEIRTGKLIDEIVAPKEATVNSTMVISVKLVNRYKDGARFLVVTSMDGSSIKESAGPLEPGGSSEVKVKLTPGREGDLVIKVQVLAEGKVVDEGVTTVRAKVPTSPPPAAQTGSAFPLPLEQVIGGMVGSILILVAIALLLRSRKPKAEKGGKIEEQEILPPVEEKVSEAPEIIPPEIGLEEIGVEIQKPKPAAGEEAPESKVEEMILPELEEKLPPIEMPEQPPAMEVKEVSPEARKSLQRELESLKYRLEKVKRSISNLEEVVGFELSLYRLVDAETSLISAELKLKEGDIEGARRISSYIKESLDVLEAEVSEAENVFLENWSAVENRIDIMLRVWGKAPANMLTMVPAGFRIHALERFRKLHPDRKLELRGDELVSLGE